MRALDCSMPRWLCVVALVLCVDAQSTTPDLHPICGPLGTIPITAATTALNTYQATRFSISCFSYAFVAKNPGCTPTGGQVLLNIGGVDTIDVGALVRGSFYAAAWSFQQTTRFSFTAYYPNYSACPATLYSTVYLTGDRSTAQTFPYPVSLWPYVGFANSSLTLALRTLAPTSMTAANVSVVAVPNGDSSSCTSSSTVATYNATQTAFVTFTSASSFNWTWIPSRPEAYVICMWTSIAKAWYAVAIVEVYGGNPAYYKLAVLQSSWSSVVYALTFTGTALDPQKDTATFPLSSNSGACDRGAPSDPTVSITSIVGDSAGHVIITIRIMVSPTPQSFLVCYYNAANQSWTSVPDFDNLSREVIQNLPQAVTATPSPPTPAPSTGAPTTSTAAPTTTRTPPTTTTVSNTTTSAPTSTAAANTTDSPPTVPPANTTAAPQSPTTVTGLTTTTRLVTSTLAPPTTTVNNTTTDSPSTTITIQPSIPPSTTAAPTTTTDSPTTTPADSPTVTTTLAPLTPAPTAFNCTTAPYVASNTLITTDKVVAVTVAGTGVPVNFAVNVAQVLCLDPSEVQVVSVDSGSDSSTVYVQIHCSANTDCNAAERQAALVAAIGNDQVAAAKGAQQQSFSGLAVVVTSPPTVLDATHIGLIAGLAAGFCGFVGVAVGVICYRRRSREQLARKAMEDAMDQGQVVVEVRPFARGRQFSSTDREAADIDDAPVGKNAYVVNDGDEPAVANDDVSSIASLASLPHEMLREGEDGGGDGNYSTHPI